MNRMPLRVEDQPAAWPLYGVDASRRIEQAASAALPAHTLMQRAGLAVARCTVALAPHARRVLVAAGPGNNGGDGFEAAMHLQAAGREVQVVFVGDAGRLPGDAAASLARARAAGVAVIDRFAEATGLKRIAHLPDVDAIRLSRLKKSTLFEMASSPEVDYVQNEYMRLAAQLWAGSEPCEARSMKDRDIFDFLGFE